MSLQIPPDNPSRGNPRAVNDSAFQRMIRESCEKEVGRIIEEEAAAAKQRVEDRVIKLKAEIAQRVLNKLRFTTEQSPEYGTVRMIVEF